MLLPSTIVTKLSQVYPEVIRRGLFDNVGNEACQKGNSLAACVSSVTFRRAVLRTDWSAFAFHSFCGPAEGCQFLCCRVSTKSIAGLILSPLQG